jgi:hypothetical protein
MARDGCLNSPKWDYILFFQRNKNKSEKGISTRSS